MTKITRPLIALIAALLMFLTGCAAPSGAPAAAPQDAAPGGVPQAPGEDGNTSERMVARTVSLTLQVDDVADAAGRVRELAAGHDGIIAREDFTGGEKAKTRATLVVSVPADRVEALLTSLGDIGSVSRRTQTATDVTEQVVDVDARIRTLQDSIARMRALMDRAGTVSEIAAVERELTERQSQLEALQAKQKSLQGRVARTPVTITLTTQSLGEGNPFLDGLLGAWIALQASVRAVLWAIGALLPIAVVVGIIWFAVRGVLRRRKASRTPAPVQTPPVQTPPAQTPPVE